MHPLEPTVMIWSALRVSTNFDVALPLSPRELLLQNELHADMYPPLDLRSIWTLVFITLDVLTPLQMKTFEHVKSEGIQGITSLHLIYI
jgi:hypothetical protein